MAINRKPNNGANAKGSSQGASNPVNHEIKVTRAKDIETAIMFDMIVNGVTIYGCSYRTLQRHDGSGEFAKIGFPSRKGNDDKYYANCYFKISEHDLEDIEKGIEELLNQ